jgi:1-deoxy-D-xylulose-5-phosphate synthase
MVEVAQKAAAGLAGKGISCGVVNARWVKPLDRRLAEWVSRYEKVVTIEDNVVSGGFGAAVLEALSGTADSGKVTILGLPDRFLPGGSVDELMRELGLDAEGVIRQVGALFG